ncbi:hypothetical protein [Natrinema sp. 74]|uniref:hypothetical protein n=1 Tax=Natrinema sp. 74 TaxID=3384159 RepID=UPI0038D51785
MRTGIGTEEDSHSANNSDRLLIPRNGTVLTQLDYSLPSPNQTCTVAGDTKNCLSYNLLEQQVNRTVRIGNQTWESDSTSPRQLEYDGAIATEPTTLQVHATINSTVAVSTNTYIRDGGGWQLSNTTTDETLTLSHTVRDSMPVAVTTNQDLNVTQTIIRSEEGIDRIVLRFEGPQTLSDRRLWSYARFKGSAGRVQNIWGVYSQRQYTNASRGRRLLTTSNTTLSSPPSNTTQLNQTLARHLAATTERQRTVPFPNVLEQGLTARSRQPTLQWTQNTSVISAPEIGRLSGFNISSNTRPLDQRVNLASVPPRGYTTIVITNVDQPIAEVSDIHNESIPLTTRTVRERNASLSTTVLNETHATIQLTDAATGQPLSDRTLWLRGAAQGRVTTNADGTVVVERRDLYVTASFTGATNVSESVYYSTAQTRIAFQQDPFNIYQLLTSLAGALVSVAAFLIFFAPFAYMRRETG